LEDSKLAVLFGYRNTFWTILDRVGSRTELMHEIHSMQLVGNETCNG
jgi:hypothetical protein